MMRAACALLLATFVVTPCRADLIVSQGTLGVQKFTDAGSLVGTLISPGTGGLIDARGVTTAPNGNIYVSDFGTGRILQLNFSGGFINALNSSADVDFPLGLTFGVGGNLYAASAGPTSNIAQLDPISGAVLNAAFTSGNPTPLGGPQFLAFGPTLAITDSAGRLFRFSAGTGAWLTTAILDNPQGVAFDAAGNLFVAQRISDNVLRIPSGGGPATVFVANGAFAGSPADLAFGPDGSLYVASSAAIYRFDGVTGASLGSFGTGGRYLAFVAIPEPRTLWLLSSILLAFLAASLLKRRSNRRA